MFLSSTKRGKSSAQGTWTNDWLLELARTQRADGLLDPSASRALTPLRSASPSTSPARRHNDDDDDDDGDGVGRVNDDGRQLSSSSSGNTDGDYGDLASGADSSSSSSLLGSGQAGDDKDDGLDDQKVLDGDDELNGQSASTGGRRTSPFDSSQYFSDFAKGSKGSRGKGTRKGLPLTGALAESARRKRKPGATTSTSRKLQEAQINLRCALDELDDAKKMVELLSSINAELENNIELLKLQITDTADTAAGKESEISSLREQLDQAHFKLRKAERRNRYVDDADRWKADAKYRKKRQDTTHLLFGFPSYEADEARENEVLKERRGAKGLVAKCVSVVTAMMDRFNMDLFQAAATCADRVENGGLGKASMASASLERAERVLGKRLVSMVLPTVPKAGDVGEVGLLNPFVLQVVIQTFLVFWCNSIIEAWYPQQATFAEFLVDVSSKLKVGNNHRMCGKKIMITQKHTQDSTNLFNDWVQDIIDDLTEVLSIFGWKVESDSRSNLLGTSHIPTTRSPMHAPLLALVKAAYDIRLAMAEISTSGDVDLVIVSCDTPFNELWMDDSYDDCRVSSQSKRDQETVVPTSIERVVGTTGIGLQREVLRPHLETGLLSRDIDMVLKPKVVLEYALIEALA